MRKNIKIAWILFLLAYGLSGLGLYLRFTIWHNITLPDWRMVLFLVLISLACIFMIIWVWWMQTLAQRERIEEKYVPFPEIHEESLE